ncbi:MAG: hypothetical protein HYX92_15195 [Chloroflexi bacterium]|nr:hypothetical protein [Chloroflexota bacterium]
MQEIALTSNVVEVEDSLEAVNRWVMENGRGDGLPVVPPTPDRVGRMIAASGRSPSDVMAVLPPKNARATVEKIAINAVMAGCLPEYFPVILAAVSAMGEPNFVLNLINTSTQSVALFLIVNGPIRQELNINSSYGCLGPGWQANATIGRTIRLIQLNIAGSIPREISKSTHGQPARYTMCMGEYEEASPWPPLHVERGFAADKSTVTVLGANGMSDVVDSGHPREKPESMLGLMALNMEGQGSDRAVLGDPTPFVIIISPPQAQRLWEEGWSKNDVKRFLYERCRNVPLSRWPEEKQQHMISAGIAVEGGTVPIIQSAEIVTVIVAGGLGGLHSLVIPARTGFTKSIQRASQSPML